MSVLNKLGWVCPLCKIACHPQAVYCARCKMRADEAEKIEREMAIAVPSGCLYIESDESQPC